MQTLNSSLGSEQVLEDKPSLCAIISFCSYSEHLVLCTEGTFLQCWFHGERTPGLTAPGDRSLGNSHFFRAGMLCGHPLHNKENYPQLSPQKGRQLAILKALGRKQVI